MYAGTPAPYGLYHPRHDRDSCGVGFIADLQGRPRHELIEKGLQVLVNLTHRGATGADPDTGDGAGILLQMPDAFLRGAASDRGIALPPPGLYAAGMVFLPPDNPGPFQEMLERAATELGCPVLGWREVPTNPAILGAAARATCPAIQQVFLAHPAWSRGSAADAGAVDAEAFELLLYRVRRRAEHAARAAAPEGAEYFYLSSLSARTLIYKGMLVAHQVDRFYPDLTCGEMATAITLVHQRYSTNTFPSWPLAQPFRYVAHNGEINTLRGNINKMAARHRSLASPLWGDAIEELLPVIQEHGSDSACFDNLLEFLVLSGRQLPHAILMMIPEAWGAKYYMGHDRRGFYEYHANFMEPWDGPAAMVFSDGVRVGGILDRNGLRPARYLVTKNDLMILGSETGVLDIPPDEVAARGRLQPGKMVLVDTERKRILYNDEVKAAVCRARPYRRWVAANRLELKGFLGAVETLAHDPATILSRQLAFGYTREDLEVILGPMASEGHEPLGSMGNDAPLAVLSDQPQLLFNYFKQIFAQVTNPPIDPIREDLVMSLTTFLGRERNLLEETPEHARRLKLLSPLLTETDLDLIQRAASEEFRTLTLDATFEAAEGPEALAPALGRLCEAAEEAIRDGRAILILSDRATGEARAAIPSLLAVSAVSQHLIRQGIRNRVGLVVESGEPREVMHFALLSGYGADAVLPYLAFESLAHLHAEGRLGAGLSIARAAENYLQAVRKGLLKILSKMGISTLRSYQGAQVFEALGLSPAFVERYFTNTATRIGGIGLAEVARETLLRHRAAYGPARGGPRALPEGGLYSYRRGGERHMWTPESIHYLQQATRRDDAELYRRFAESINRQERKHTTLRSLFDLRPAGTSVPLAEVEPAEAIVRRFVTGAMSFGSLSREAHETLAIAMNRLGARSNSGEGGEDPARYRPLPNGDSLRSAVKQVASGRFGVTVEYLANAEEIQIKIAQGAKPGEGGQLPGDKVDREIGRVRHATPGVSLISPPPHHDIYSIEDLAQLIFDLKNANPEARVSVKLVSETGVGTIAAGVSKGKADMVLISGGDGGTGASPLSSIKHAGLPLELGLAETQHTLVANRLRGRIRVQTDGQIRTGRDVAICALLGAEEFGFATAALVVLGCVMMRKCHNNTCPVGVATQDPRLRQRFRGRPEYLIRYFHFVAEELRGLMAGLGFRTVDEMVGRADCLTVREGVEHWKAKTLDLTPLFFRAGEGSDTAVRRVEPQTHGLEKILDRQLLDDCRPALESGKAVERRYRIRNVDRATGAMLSGAIAKQHGLAGLPEGTITLRFSGSAGQSFGAFAARGLTLILEGDANDYVGKGLSGGTLVLRPDPKADFDPAANVIAGNTVLYGATGGAAFFSGLAGERFAIRNSGARAVVEGVGDHCCEYMTGGVVAVLGETGVNFAAGMSGGIAYVYDPRQDFDLRCNLAMVDLDPLTEAEDVAALRALVEEHKARTESPRAAWMLTHWDEVIHLFVKVMPIEYRRALGRMETADLKARKTAEETVTHD